MFITLLFTIPIKYVIIKPIQRSIMSEEKRYSIMELQTTGWETLFYNLPQTQCTEKYDMCIGDGIAPERLKIVRVK